MLRGATSAGLYTALLTFAKLIVKQNHWDKRHRVFWWNAECGAVLLAMHLP